MSQSGVESRKVGELIWRQDLYPRFEPNPAIIQQYAEDLSLLPPIEVNQHNEIIDGYHRWTAYKKVLADEQATKEEKEVASTIEVTVTQTEGDRHFARLAMRRNAKHGLYISSAEKKNWLLTWYTGLNEEEKQELAGDMGVSLRTVKRWTARKDKDLKEKRKQEAFALWLACWTYEEIGEKLGISEATVIDWIDSEKSSENDKWHKLRIFPDYGLDPDWKPPLYSVWKQQEKSNQVSHYGNSEQSILDNLLYMYTEPFDIVVDPFAGGGSTVDVCKKRLRRYWVSDRLPIVERLDIRQADIAEGPPLLHKRWGEAALLYLDPPYWKQNEGRYSKDPEDLANMDLEDFYNTLTNFVLTCSEKMRPGACIAMLMQPTQWKAEDKKIVDHIVDIVVRIQSPKIRYERRIDCPYESQQANAQQVEWAKENRDVLEISRELILWEIV